MFTLVKALREGGTHADVAVDDHQDILCAGLPPAFTFWTRRRKHSHSGSHQILDRNMYALHDNLEVLVGNDRMLCPVCLPCWLAAFAFPVFDEIKTWYANWIFLMTECSLLSVLHAGLQPYSFQNSVKLQNSPVKIQDSAV